MAGSAPFLIRRQARRALLHVFSAQATDAVLEAADQSYVAPPPVARTAGGRLNLQMAAYLLALRDALLDAGFTRTYANGLLIDGLFRAMWRFNRAGDLLALAVHPSDAAARERWRQHFSRRVYFRRPDWVMSDVRGGRCYSFDVRRCVLADYMRERGESDFCQEVICSQDLLMAQSRDQTLIRTGTIAGGARRCDFRFVDLVTKARD